MWQALKIIEMGLSCLFDGSVFLSLSVMAFIMWLWNDCWQILNPSASATQRLRYSVGPNPEFPGEGNGWCVWDQLPALIYLTASMIRKIELMQGPNALLGGNMDRLGGSSLPERKGMNTRETEWKVYSSTLYKLVVIEAVLKNNGAWKVSSKDY